MSKADERKPWFTSNYERIVVCIVFAMLIGSLGYLAGRSSRKPLPLPKPPVLSPGPGRVDGGPYREALMRAHSPGQLGEGKLVTVPETRVACLDCRRPVPIEDFRARKQCSWCPAIPPPPDISIDRDKDDMWDSWEKKYGLDPEDPNDANLDPDDDSFTNLEEFWSDTNPKDVNQCPLATVLRVKKILAAPFRLIFAGVSTLPDGTLRFGLNAPEISYFKKLGEEAEGWKIIKYEPKKEKQTRRGITGTVDVGVLTLQKGDKTIRLVRGQRYSEYKVQLYFKLDKTDHPAMRGKEIEIRGKTYKVIKIDGKSKAVLLERSDRRRFTIITEPPPPAPEPEE